jgi:putative transposase
MIEDASKRHHRRSIRLPGCDYAAEGAHFLTVCSHQRGRLFGRIVDGRVHLSRCGRIVQAEWMRAAPLRDDLRLGEYVVMPNHFHGIVFISRTGRGTARRALTAERFNRPVSGSLPTIVRSSKSAVTGRINRLRGTPGAAVWQRNYYEHVIRDEEDLFRIREYILANPGQWAFDRENPDAVRRPDRRTHG